MNTGTLTRALLAGAIAAGSFAAAGMSAHAAELDSNALLNADKDANNWPMYHRTYNSWHYSPLDQINASNVKDLKVAWIHNPGASPHGGIQSFPLAIDGRLYYTIANDQIWAVDGATGAPLWTFKPKIDD